MHLKKWCFLPDQLLCSLKLWALLMLPSSGLLFPVSTFLLLRLFRLFLLPSPFLNPIFQFSVLQALLSFSSFIEKRISMRSMGKLSSMENATRFELDFSSTKTVVFSSSLVIRFHFLMRLQFLSLHQV